MKRTLDKHDLAYALLLLLSIFMISTGGPHDGKMSNEQYQNFYMTNLLVAILWLGARVSKLKDRVQRLEKEQDEEQKA